MTILRTRAFKWLVGAAIAGLTACRANPSLIPAPRAAPSAAACPAPVLPGTEWIFVDDSAGLTLALPPGFQERPSGGDFRHWELGTDFQQSMTFGVIHGDLGLSGYRRVYQPELMLDYSECSETIVGYAVSIQAWRTPNGVFRDYRRFDRYDVFALWEARPGVFFYLAGGTHHRPTQDLFLAAVRAWRSRNR